MRALPATVPENTSLLHCAATSMKSQRLTVSWALLALSLITLVQAARAQTAAPASGASEENISATFDSLPLAGRMLRRTSLRMAKS